MNAELAGAIERWLDWPLTATLKQDSKSPPHILNNLAVMSDVMLSD
jgi:hypothetical protein